METQNVKDRLENLVNQLVAKIQETKLTNEIKKYTLDQASEILQLAIGKTVLLIQNTCDDLSKPEKKELAMQIVSNFYDQVFKVVSIPFVPTILQPVFQGFLKQILMLVVSGAINGLVTTFHDKGVM